MIADAETHRGEDAAAARAGRRPQRARLRGLPGAQGRSRRSARRCPSTSGPAPRCWSRTPGRPSRSDEPVDRLRALTGELQQMSQALSTAGPGRRRRIVGRVGQRLRWHD